MQALYSTQLGTNDGEKSIEVYSCDIATFDKEIDILLTSAFVNAYEPTPNTIFGALHENGISVRKLSKSPEIDLRYLCNTWLSKEIPKLTSKIHRIGCVELIDYYSDYDYTKIEQSMINSIRSFFSMLDIANIYGIKMETVALPLLGSGSQHISASLMIVPLLNECISFLKRNSGVKRICFIERNPYKANLISNYIQSSYSVLMQSNIAKPEATSARKPCAFISYASGDKNIADNLCSKLESNGIQVWYAPRDVKGPYADAITQAIDRCTHFVVILSQNSMQSQHVLNEIDLAFQGLPNNIKFKPLRIDNSIFTPAFKYYLSRQHWMDAIVPPLEERLNEFVKNILIDL